ncbi:MAG: helix-turn-helix transcriptional regulator [Gammaproteobacteria bacterium]
MHALDCTWADRHSIIKFFNDIPAMDLEARLNYFHDVFPFAESLPVNFYLFDANDINIACNEAAMKALGDKAITEYVGYTTMDYFARKGWPKWMAENQTSNNNAAIINGNSVCHEFTLEKEYKKKWISKKQAIYDDNGLAVGIVGLSIPIGLGGRSIYWDGEAKRITISFADNLLVELTVREFCVLQGLLNGGTADEIAKQEMISIKTVETYVMRIKIKLKCRKLRDVISLLIKNELARDIIEFKR